MALNNQNPIQYPQSGLILYDLKVHYHPFPVQTVAHDLMIQQACNKCGKLGLVLTTLFINLSIFDQVHQSRNQHEHDTLHAFYCTCQLPPYQNIQDSLIDQHVSAYKHFFSNVSRISKNVLKVIVTMSKIGSSVPADC
jgi:hypothetical protein